MVYIFAQSNNIIKRKSHNSVNESVYKNVQFCSYNDIPHEIELYLIFFLSFACFAIVDAAPPEIIVERSWVHASEGYDIELACIIHGDVTSDVSTKP